MSKKNKPIDLTKWLNNHEEDGRLKLRDGSVLTFKFLMSGPANDGIDVVLVLPKTSGTQHYRVLRIHPNGNIYRFMLHDQIAELFDTDDTKRLKVVTHQHPVDADEYCYSCGEALNSEGACDYCDYCPECGEHYDDCECGDWEDEDY